MRWTSRSATSPSAWSAGGPARRALRRAALALLCALATACGPRAQPPADGSFSIATYNLQRYGLHDRDGDGQRAEPKPEAECIAVADTIAALRPDILALQEIGNERMLDQLAQDLRKRGLDYPHRDYVRRGASEMNLALLSRFPIAASRPRLDDTYTIGGTIQPVLRGFLEAELDLGGGERLTVFVAHLKSRSFHPLGQTEMRRNEARLLANHVRRVLRNAPDAAVIVVGDFNDSFNSAPLRLLRGEDGEPLLVDLRPLDEPGGVWTFFNRADDSYERFDYLLASPALARRLRPDSCRVHREPPAALASDHRPVVAVFDRSARR